MTTTLVTGGTGSFGHAYSTTYGPVRILSRDEEKQRAMIAKYPEHDYHIGDVRDRDSLRRAMEGVTEVFHAAALKQVPQCEHNPGEAYRTNVVGTENVCIVAREFGARVVTLSTDKAVLPVGVMGATKMLAEAVTTSYGFNVVRYGNVLGSRGSIVPVFRALVDAGEPITITDRHMTRFLITLPEAIGLVRLAMDSDPDGTVFVRKSPAATVDQLIRALAGERYPTKVIGIRPGEKLHEDLITETEHATDCGEYFRVRRNVYGGRPFTSDKDAQRLTDRQLRRLLATI